MGASEGDVSCLGDIQEKQPATEAEPGIETEAPILWPPDAKSQLWKTLMAREGGNR